MKLRMVSFFMILPLALMVTAYSLVSCTDVKGDADPSLLALAGTDIDPGASDNAYYYDQFYPPYWLNWTTDGSAAIQCDSSYLTGGFKCKGRYCDDVNLLCRGSGFNQTSSWWTDYFSEEGTNWRVCDSNAFVTGIRCTGKYCDNVSLRCSQLDNGGVRQNCYWTSDLSEEDGGTFVAPESMFVAGARCSGRYCDNMQFYLCRADSGALPDDFTALAQQFAPRLRFDQQFGTGSGEQSKCFPGDPGTYYEQRALGVEPVELCNKSYASIANNQVPVYYMAKQAGTNTVVIRYWYFYAWQSTCFTSFGSHSADWESMAVLIVDGQLRRVAFYQHGGWYSRNAGSFETVGGTHPVAYVGKNAHGSYHDSGGSGGCLYFEDFRNPGGNDYHMDTWNNMVLLARGSGMPAWMNCTGSGCFDGIGHPVEQTGELGGFGGCNKDGCNKTQVGGNVPFITAP
ncbi:MAG TPA: hypothetical protein PLA65_10075 [Spirochaetota bacterium]|nr:hypothetical protein [Spirochaetota bacterium]HPG49490.1 hypothetical protein [Spirochaetota bacterium]HPN12398.1 hypothetical protein [Spirochaetota bacterium]